MLRSALVVYAIVMTLAALSPLREVWDELLGPNEALLVIISPSLVRDVRVTYGGRPIQPRPQPPSRDVFGYATFPALRTGVLEPVLQVSWDGPSGPMTVTRSMRQFDSGRRCLYVLELDSNGAPVGQQEPDDFSPFWWTCHAY
jgi:hypothetical protein